MAAVQPAFIKSKPGHFQLINAGHWLTEAQLVYAANVTPGGAGVQRLHLTACGCARAQRRESHGSLYWCPYYQNNSCSGMIHWRYRPNDSTTPVALRALSNPHRSAKLAASQLPGRWRACVRQPALQRNAPITGEGLAALLAPGSGRQGCAVTAPGSAHSDHGVARDPESVFLASRRNETSSSLRRQCRL